MPELVVSVDRPSAFAEQLAKAQNAAKSLDAEGRLKLLLKADGSVDWEGKPQISVQPIPVSLSWGQIMSAVLVGNLLAFIIAGVIYAAVTGR